jgi:GntR family transcriptional repressor for pyruvate dehydrogenase complex
MEALENDVEQQEFERIGRKRLFRQVVQQIEARIIEGSLKPGDMLPPERVMTEQFGVSRTVIREAIKALEHGGLVKVEHGRGVMVVRPSADSVTDSMIKYVKIQQSPIWALHELRSILEVEMARLAAERRNMEDIEKLNAIVRRMSAKVNSPAEYVELDIEFHLAIADAAHNQLFSMVLRPFMSLMQEARRVGATVPYAPTQTIKHHKGIAEAIKNRDGSEARRMMQEHLDLVEHFIAEGESIE